MTKDEVLKKSAVLLDGLHPLVKQATIKLIGDCYDKGIYIRITQGLRTIAEQNALYAQGRTTKGPIVTNARGGYSWHNFGYAIDFVLIDSAYDMKADKFINKVADWSEVAQLAKTIGFEWGGDWTSFKDYPHFQMTFGLTLVDARNGKKPTQAQLNAVLTIVQPEPLKEGVNMLKIKAILTKDNSVIEGFNKDNVNYIPVSALTKLGLKVSWDNINKKLYIS
ncbi:M15 family metallopeptidase [Paenibacillus sp. FSL R7-0204]|uniref:M15 family metallopeptidase n=1 Tax=Paenibacillus sp. FSL R7-0204 TaxID=2921675 RepID=UPI0030F8FE3A